MITYDAQGNCTKCKLPGSGFVSDGVCQCSDTNFLLEFNPGKDSKDDELPFDLSSPEDVLIEVAGPHDDNSTNLDWKNWSIESTTVINGAENVMGAASYEAAYGSFLDYTIQGMIDCPGAGWFVVEKVTGSFTKGDGWMTDDDMDFYCGEVRPATPDEIKMA